MLTAKLLFGFAFLQLFILTGSATTYVPSKPTVTIPLQTTFIGGYPISRVRFHCDFTMSTTENLFYRVSWWRNDDSWYTTPYATNSTTDELLLTEDIFRQKGFRLGEKISCTVRAFEVADGPPGKPSPRSDAKFIGIQVLTPSLAFQNGEKSASKRTVRLKPTVPVGCTAADSCSIWLTAYTNVSSDFEKCNGLVLDKTSCGTSIDSKTYDKELHITVTTQETGQYQTKDDVYYVHLKTGETPENELWSNYHLPPIKVLVTQRPTQIYQGKKCYAHKSHMATFDSKHYENPQAGVFTLYKHTVFDAEIQIQHETCNPYYGIATECTCGIAVRAGQDTYVINLCDGKIEFGYKTCGDRVVIAKSFDSTHYKIILPYGTYVDVTVVYTSSGGGPARMIFVDVIPSIYDDNSASMGLCGRLNGDCLNDFHHRDGSATKNYCLETLNYHNSPVEFINSWKVTSTFENMFHPNFKLIRTAKPWPHNVCGCENTAHATGSSRLTESVPCQRNTVATCTTSRGKVVNGQCIQATHGHQLTPTVSVPSSIIIGRKKRAANNNTFWTEVDAREFCDMYMKRSPIFELCINVSHATIDFSIRTCVRDILSTGNPELAFMSMEGMRVSCLSELERNTTLRETNKNSSQPSIAQLIEEKACPNSCSESGICVKGKCHCDDGFGSTDCSQDMSKVPTLSGLLNHGFCDKQLFECDHAFVFGHIFSDVGNLTCKLEEFSVSQEGTRVSRATHYLPGEFETLVEISCPLHKVRDMRLTTTSSELKDFVFGYSISVSNDGNHFQKDGLDLFVYDSECQLVTNISGQMHFKLKDGYYFLDNKCVPDGK